MVVELANMSATRGDNVTILAGWPEDPGLMQNQLNPAIGVKFVGKTKKLAYLQIIPWIMKNRKWISSHDLLHCHLTYGALFGSMTKIILQKFFRKKSPVIVETNHAVGMPVPKLNRWLHSKLMLFRSGVIFMAKDQYGNNFIKEKPANKTDINPNGIAIQKRTKNEDLKRKLHTEIGITGVRYLVGTISMLRPDRKPWLYIPIFRNIYNVLGNDVHFVLAGGGIEYDKIKAMVEEQGLSDHVYMPGLINDPVCIMADLDVYVSLCAGETAGISMIEAAMCNTPVVGIQLNEGYQQTETDWVWSSMDPEEIARKIIFLLQNAEERKKTAESQNEYVTTHFTSEVMYAAYDSFYKEILAQ